MVHQSFTAGLLSLLTRAMWTLVAVSVLVYSPVTMSVASAAAPAPTAPTKTCSADADIFYAVFFGEGPAAKLLPSSYTDARKQYLASESKQSNKTRLEMLKRTQAKLTSEGKTADAALVQKAVEFYEKWGDKPVAKPTAKSGAERFLDAFKQRYPGELEKFAGLMRSGNPVSVRAGVRSTINKAMDVAMVLGTLPPGGTAREPYPEEDSSIAVVTLTFIVLFVVVWVAFPLKANTTGDQLQEDQIIAFMSKAFQC